MRPSAWFFGSLIALTPVLLMASAANQITVANAPPVVVKTVPEAGSVDIDPELKQIQVTFSKEMLDKSWSWTGKEQMPETTGTPSYKEDKRTCILPVKLEPGKEYAIGINSPSFKNFKDTENRSAMPYLIVFRTKSK